MSSSQKLTWSNNPNAPEISHSRYFWEKAYFAGILVGSILYGTVIVLFFKCVAALLNPAHRKGDRIKWGLVSYTAVMFSFVTIQIAVALHLQSTCYIDNRNFPGIEGVVIPGPYGYQASIHHEAIDIAPSALFFVNGWLADGLLLWRCYVIYSKSFWMIAIPCLVYLGSLVMGIIDIYQTIVTYSPLLDWSALPYYWITLSLNVLLTLMIILQLILHARNTRTALGITGIGGLCKAIITISLALIIGARTAGNPIMNIFMCVAPGAQVIASLLIIQRVANKSALTGNTVVSAHMSEFKAETRGRSTGGSGDLPGEDPTTSTDERRTSFGESGGEVETTIDSHRDKV